VLLNLIHSTSLCAELCHGNVVVEVIRCNCSRGYTSPPNLAVPHRSVTRSPSRPETWSRCPDPPQNRSGTLCGIHTYVGEDDMWDSCRHRQNRRLDQLRRDNDVHVPPVETSRHTWTLGVDASVLTPRWLYVL